MSNEILAGIFILLNLLDAITTLIFMHQKGGKGMIRQLAGTSLTRAVLPRCVSIGRTREIRHVKPIKRIRTTPRI